MKSTPAASPYSWQFLGLWLTLTMAGGAAGALISQLLEQDAVAGLALGVVGGNIGAIALHYWRVRPPLAPPLMEANVRLMPWVLLTTALGCLGYLTAGWLGVPFSAFFPWDGIGLLALCGVGALCLRQGRTFLAASALMSGLFLPMAFNAQYYGMASPANAVYVLGLLISGLVLGSNGFFGGLAAMATLTALFAVGEQAGSWRPVVAPGTPAQSAALVVFWWAVYGAGAWLSWLFARTVESALQVSRGQTQALARAVNALTGEAGLEALLGLALTSSAEQLGAGEASVWLLDAQRDQVVERLHYQAGGWAPAPAMASAPPLPIWRELRRTGQPVVITDVANDPRLNDRARLLAAGVRGVLAAPLRSGGEVAGFVAIYRADRAGFAADEVDLAQALAQQAMLAIQMTRLAEQNRQAAIVDERNRMAREMHDTLAQGFTGIVVQLEAAEDALGAAAPEAAARHLNRARTLARESLAEARRSVWALRPLMLEQRPLAAALRDSTLALTEGAPVALTLEVPAALPALPPETETDLLRLAQEAVTNALRHAEARTLRLTVRVEAGQLWLEVADDGRGFDPQAATPRAEGGLGLPGMRERAARHGGAVTVDSAPGRGTLVRCWMPL